MKDFNVWEAYTKILHQDKVIGVASIDLAIGYCHVLELLLCTLI